MTARRNNNSSDDDAIRDDGPYADQPGKSGGIVAWFKHKLGGWFGPTASRDTRAGEDLSAEKARSGPPGVVFPWFLPYVDDYTAETAQARLAYRKMMADPNVKAAVLGKVLDVAALDLSVQPADRRSKKHKRVAEFVKWNLEERLRGCVPELIWSILSGGLIDGYSVCEKVFGYQEQGKYRGKWPLVAVKPKDVGTDLILQTDDFRNVIGVMGVRYNAGLVFPPSRFLIYRHLPLYDQPTGMSDFRAAYSRWWLLDTVLKLRGMNAEKRAVPHLVGTYQTAAQKPSLEAVLAAAKSQSWSSIPEGVRIEAMAIAGSADDIFATFIKDLKHDIFLAIQGAILQALEGSVSDGRGNSQVHRNTADLLVWYLSQTVKSLFNDREQGLVKDIVDLNYVIDEHPRVSLGSVGQDEIRGELDTDYKLWQMGVSLSLEEMYERYNRKPPEAEEDTLLGQGKEPPGEEEGGGDGGDLASMLGGGDEEGGEEDGDDGLFTFGEDGLEEFAAKDWTKMPAGPKGGKRWQHKSGRIVYSKDNPGGAGDARKEQKEQGRASVKDQIKALVRSEDGKAKPYTTEEFSRLADMIGSLTIKDIDALKKELGLKATRSGKKEQYAKMLADMALKSVAGRKKARPEAPPLSPPEPVKEGPPAKKKAAKKLPPAAATPPARAKKPAEQTPQRQSPGDDMAAMLDRIKQQQMSKKTPAPKKEKPASSGKAEAAVNALQDLNKNMYNWDRYDPDEAGDAAYDRDITAALSGLSLKDLKAVAQQTGTNPVLITSVPKGVDIIKDKLTSRRGMWFRATYGTREYTADQWQKVLADRKARPIEPMQPHEDIKATQPDGPARPAVVSTPKREKRKRAAPKVNPSLDAAKASIMSAYKDALNMEEGEVEAAVDAISGMSKADVEAVARHLSISRKRPSKAAYLDAIEDRIKGRRGSFERASQ